MTEAINIIIAEDHQYFRTHLVRDLEDHAITTIGQAANGRELMALLEARRPDVLLLDLNMPVMDGNEALREINRRFPRMRIIILTQHDDQGLMENYISRGVLGYLPKQFISSDISILAQGIKAVKSGGTFYYSYDPSHPTEKYTLREVDIIPRLLHGKTSREIGNELGISEKTVEGLRKHLFKKTQSRNLAEFVRSSIKKGLEFLGH